MIGLTTGHEALSFMNFTVGYNKIQMTPEDQEAIAFRTLKCIFYYKLMHFGLNNARATYKREMQTILRYVAQNDRVLC